MALLLFLLQHHERMVPLRELLPAVWPGVRVSAAAVSTALKELRRSLGDDGVRQYFIRRKRSHGMQFVAPVRSSPAADTRSCKGGLFGFTRGLSMFFVGRERELEELERLLLDPGQAAMHVAIEGPPGIGKTELALQLVHRLTRDGHFPGGAFWLNAENPDLSSAWGAQLASELGIDIDSAERRTHRVLRQLGQSRAPTLVVLDNVESWEPARRPSPLPTGPHIRVLCTTRVRNLGGAAYRHLSLDILRPPDDRTLLCKLAARDLEPGVDTLLERLDGHALALEIAGAYLATRSLETAQDYLRALRDQPDRIDRSVRGRVAYDRSLDSSLSALWNRLDSASQRAWTIAACFSPTPATVELAHLAGIEAGAFHVLEGLHLVQTRGHGRWSMHRLVRAFAHRRAGAELRAEARDLFIRGCVARAEAVDRTQGTFVPEEDTIQIEAAIHLAPSLEQPAVELALLLAVGASTVIDNGHAFPTRKQSFERSLELSEQLGGIEGLCGTLGRYLMHYSLSGDATGAGRVTAHLESLADREGAALPRLQAHCARGMPLFELGRLRESLRWLHAATDVLDSNSLSPATLSPKPLRAAGLPAAADDVFGGPATALINAALLCGLSGDLARADAHFARFHERLAQPFHIAAKATSLCQLMVIQTIHGRYASSVSSASELIRVARIHDLDFHIYAGQFHRSWALIQAASDPSQAHLETLLRAFERMRRITFDYLLAFRLGLVARALHTFGHSSEALRVLDRALQQVETRDERFFESELWRIRARCLEEPALVRRSLERALTLADAMGASLWALRAASDRLEFELGLEPLEEPEHGAARREVAKRLESLPTVQGQWPDLTRARQLLATSHA